MAGKPKDITGQKFGKLTAVMITDKRDITGSCLWHCKCDCGNETDIALKSLTSGNTKSCGCLRTAKDITGQKFGRLTAINCTSKKDTQGSYMWHCKCDCGNEKDVAKRRLTSGRTKSCGCFRATKNITTQKKAKDIATQNGAKDITGQKFGKLTAIRWTGMVSSSHGRIWYCKCDCGGEKNVPISRLIRNVTKSCGCYNKLCSTAPHLVPLLVDKELATKIGLNHNRSAFFTCPSCEEQYEDKPAHVNHRGGLCKKCSIGGKSRAEIIAAHILEQNGIHFEPEKTFKASGRLRYDIYLPDTHSIIELHGGQHYREVPYFSAKTLADEQMNDKLKKDIAINEIKINKYICIDCSKYHIQDLINTISQSFHTHLGCSLNIDKTKLYTCFVDKELWCIADCYNNGFSMKQLRQEFNMNQSMIKYRLSKLHDLGIVNYIKRNCTFPIPILCTNNQGCSEQFASILEAVRYVQSHIDEKKTTPVIKNHIKKVLNGEQSSYKGFHFERINSDRVVDKSVG